ncbi:hypothetical protein V6N13_004776 [Hibiscus sabdariffa]
MGVKTFLLTIDDKDFFIMLEDVNWSYLKEIFEEVMSWSENMDQAERAPWLEISGMPLQCWNHLTIKRIVESYDTFKALGENSNHTKDCEKVTILISTGYERKIEDLIDVEVGKITYRVRVGEIDFSEESSKDNLVKKNDDLQDDEELVEDPSVGSSRSRLTKMDRRNVFHVEDGVVNVVFVRKKMELTLGRLKHDKSSWDAAMDRMYSDKLYEGVSGNWFGYVIVVKLEDGVEAMDFSLI